MDTCTFKVGFFNLRLCGQPASGVCANTGRPVCIDHGVRMSDGSWVAVDQVKNMSMTERDKIANVDDDYNGAYGRAWLYGRRNHYYSAIGYNHRYHSHSSHHDHYDDRDAAALGAAAAANEAMEDGEEGPLFDS